MNRALAALLVVGLSGCIDIDFDAPSIVQTKRILAISADPPESIFGDDVTFEVLAVDEDGEDLLAAPGVTVRWTVCLSVAEVFGAAGLGAGVDLDDTCDVGGPDLIALETEGLPPSQARLDGDLLLALATMIMQPGGMPGALPPGVTQEQLDTLLSVITIVGVPLRARVEIFEDGELILTGLKRFAITTRPDPTTVPPPPRFAIDGAFVTARDGDEPRACEPESGEPIRVAAAQEVTLSPADGEEEWIEEYPVFNLTGELQINQESAFYNWFATGGEIGREVTQLGDHDTVWTTPETPGEHFLWVVVRDGHLGTSWCRARVTVGN